MKVLDPHRQPLPRSAPAAIIWLDRAPREQARSIAKFGHLVGGMPAADRRMLRAFEAGLVRDRALALRAVPKPLLALRFEEVLIRPHAAAHRMAAALAPWWPGLRTEAMARVVIPRPPECLPGLLELTLLARAEAAERATERSDAA